eukprot:scaffold110230_cov66-Phaeocystis_antarctica.AAC.4
MLPTHPARLEEANQLAIASQIRVESVGKLPLWLRGRIRLQRAVQPSGQGGRGGGRCRGSRVDRLLKPDLVPLAARPVADHPRHRPLPAGL